MEVIEYWNPLVRRHRPTAGSSQFEAGIDTLRRYVCVFEVNSSGASGTTCCIARSIRASSAAKCWNWICLTRAAKPNRPSATSKTAGKHAWAFAPRFRRVAFGWRSEPAIARIKEAMVAIKAISKMMCVSPPRAQCCSCKRHLQPFRTSTVHPAPSARPSLEPSMCWCQSSPRRRPTCQRAANGWSSFIRPTPTTRFRTSKVSAAIGASFAPPQTSWRIGRQVAG